MDKRKLQDTLINKYKDTKIDENVLKNLFDNVYNNSKNEQTIKKLFDQSVNNLLNIKERLFSKYYFYNIDIKEFDETFNEITRKNYELIDMTGEFEKIMDKKVLNKINSKEIDINQITLKYNFLKTMIKMNSKYNLSKDKIDKCYNNAIELLKIRYDENETMSFNIISNMKYIIQNNFIDEDIRNIVKYNLNFFKEYLELSANDSIEKISNEIDISVDLLNDYIYNNMKASSDVVDLLCILYDCEDYNELKNKIIDTTKKLFEEKKKIFEEKNKNIIENHTKNKEKSKKYSLKFLKEYVQLYNLSKRELAEKLHCGINKVDDILDGKILVSYTIIDDIAFEFGANDYNSMFNMVINKIEKVRQNKKEKDQLEQNKKVLIEKTQEIKKEKKETNVIILDEMDEKKIFEILDVRNMDYKDCIITLLLFSNQIKKDPDEISLFLSVNKSYILKVYINDLDTLKEALTKENSNIKLIHRNEEVD